MIFRAVLQCFSLILPSLILSACAITGPAPSELPKTTDCRAKYADVDARVETAGVGDARYYRIPGFPYLRSDRLTASFASEIGGDLDRFWKWSWHLRDNDNNAREFELLNLGIRNPERTALQLELRSCAAWLSDLELEEPARRKRLIETAAVPDDYSIVARTLGLYPFAVPFLKLGIGGYQNDVTKDYAKPPAQLDTPGPLLLWKLRRTVEESMVPKFLGNESHDELGRVGLPTSSRIALAEEHAPAWWIETAGDYDRPGAPVLREDGPAIDTARPVIYWQSSFTRFGGETLLQMNYLIWFSARPPKHPGDPYAGTLDGIVWRVTFDRDGRPMAYDTIHACGCYHYWFPRPGLERRATKSFWQEAPLFPQAEIPDGKIAVRVQSGTHYVRRVIEPAQAIAQETREYELRPFEDLLSLPAPDGSSRSLFGADGIVAGTERSERRWLWPSGVRSAGAMRVLGRHATAFVGRQHFDDPFLFEKMFVVPR